MRKRISLFLVMVVMMAMVGACAGVQEKWNALTPDEKARIVIGDVQAQINTLFDTGKAYVTANPKYQDIWKSKIVPAFSVANQSLASVITLGKTKPLNPELVYAQVMGQVNNVLALLIQIGAIKP